MIKDSLDFSTLLRPLLESFGVVDWGYTEDISATSFTHFSKWIDAGKEGPLSYLSDHRKDARKDLRSVVPNVQSALCFLFSYHPEKLALESFYKTSDSNGLKVASYALGFEGKDYHFVVKDYLEQIAKKIEDISKEELSWRHSLDIQPVLERDLAYRAGLGWFGKNSMLINKEHGSFFIIGSLLFEKKFSLDSRELESDHCGQCRACIDACPTAAIDESSRTLEAAKCISTWTIELFKEGPVAPKGMEKANQEIFGCDICQDVCPWNQRPVRMGLEAQSDSDFQEKSSLLLDNFLQINPSDLKEALEESSNSSFQKKFRETPLGRTGRRGLLKNLQFWKKS